jgi:putative membrane-bound dehydrogenase-like protein
MEFVMFRAVGPSSVFLALTFAFSISIAAEPAPFQPSAITVPDGYTVELAAGPPLVEHPLMAGFDDRGRLYIAENAGQNMQRPALEEHLPNYIARLEDTDGDGRFDKRTVFADKLTFPQGALWHDGWLYVASSGAIWRFQDKDDDGVAETREKIVGNFGYTGNAADVHGCFLGPEGRIYWCEGRHGHDIVDAAGQTISKGKAARIFSCLTDGSDVRVHCGGGMDNPVEIDWTDAGEMLGTVNIFYHKRGDCLVHWMHGGVYPRHDQPLMLAEFRRTGDPLDAVHDYGHVAVSGCCRLRGSTSPLSRRDHAALPGVDAGAKQSTGAGSEKAELLQPPAATFFVTEFNTHKVVRTKLTRDGSTFKAEVSDFLQAASDDFHPTDVLEDADGSLLVIDTGGWFRIGCPTSQIAKPNILGAIYRVRRTDAKKIDDPRGLSVDWNELGGTQLAGLLGDARHAVRERAIATLARQGDAAVPYLSRAMTNKDPTIRRNAVWTLTRIGSPKARETVRLIGLTDREPSVLAAAIYCAGATKDEAAVEDLTEILTQGGNYAPRDGNPHAEREDHSVQPQIVRQAATSLGQIGEPRAAPAILEVLHRDSDRVLEHALIYALIEMDARDAAAEALASDSPRVRRAALIALDQMPSGNLTRDEVAALLDTTDQPLMTAALDAISRRPGWSDELVGLATKLLGQKELSDSEQSLLSGSLVAFAKDEKVQALVAQSLARPNVPPTHLSLLLDVIARSDVQPLPAAWVEALKGLLTSNTDALVQAAIPAAGIAGDKQVDELLLAVARDAKRPLDTRLSAIAAAIPRQAALGDAEFEFLCSALAAESPLSRLSAARTLTDVKLSEEQLSKLIVAMKAGGSDVPRAVMPAYERASPAILKQLQEAGLLALMKQPIYELGGLNQKADLTRLATIESELPTGGVQTGREVFFGKRAACSSCHRVGSEGGKIGPDLSKVGERRNELDLLEALLFPAASIARGFESHAILTADGRQLTGLVVRETADSLFLRTSDQREVRLRREDVDQIKASTLSIMPAGLENTMSRQELADLLAYLRSLR